MKVAKLLIPGEFEDAFLYRGWLIAVTVNRTVDVYDFRHMVSSVGSTLSQGDSFLPMLFLRNEWLHGAQFNAFMSNADVYSTFCSFFDDLPSPIEVVESQGFIHHREPIGIDSRAILDLNIYNDRLFLGLDKGCFQQDFHWSSRAFAPKMAMAKRFDARCFGITTGFGALNLSCGDEGLFSSSDVFDWDARINPTHAVERIAGASLRSAWLHDDLMNYSNGAKPELHRGHSTEKKSKAKKLVEVYRDQIPLDDLFSKMKNEYHVTDDDVQFSFNSNDRMFVHTYDGRFFGIEVVWKKGDVPRPKLTTTYKGENSRILSAGFCHTGTAIETERRVFLFAKGLWHPLLDEEVISLRTFPDQRQLANTVLAVTEAGIFVISTFDDTEFARRRQQQ